jgi:hypothetical protein
MELIVEWKQLWTPPSIPPSQTCFSVSGMLPNGGGYQGDESDEQTLPAIPFSRYKCMFPLFAGLEPTNFWCTKGELSTMFLYLILGLDQVVTSTLLHLIKVTKG